MGNISIFLYFQREVKLKKKMATVQVLSKDQLKIQQVREKMRQQWDDDITRNKLAKRVLLSAHKLDMEITMMKRDDKGSVMLLSDLTDGTKDVNKRLAELLARDPRQLPQEAIEAARRASKREPWEV